MNKILFLTLFLTTTSVFASAKNYAELQGMKFELIKGDRECNPDKNAVIDESIISGKKRVSLHLWGHQSCEGSYICLGEDRFYALDEGKFSETEMSHLSFFTTTINTTTQINENKIEVVTESKVKETFKIDAGLITNLHLLIDRHTGHALFEKTISQDKKTQTIRCEYKQL